jgi:gamma-glutamyltranspeptidase/glutathione hydrolase
MCLALAPFKSVLVLTSALPSSAQRPLNLGFERVSVSGERSATSPRAGRARCQFDANVARRTMVERLGFLALAGLLSSCMSAPPAKPPSAEATDGMVASAHPVATDAGVAVLASGGNAFDAAVAVAATLNVVEPMMSGIGGYGTILLYDAKQRRVHFLNSSGRIPRAVDADAFRPPTPGFMENRRGAKAVSTPGNLHAWEALWKTYGSRPWRELFASAIIAADSGYVIGEQQALMIADAFSEFPPHARAIYGHDGASLRADARLVQRDLANSLRMIARQGASAFYQGSIGATIDSVMRATGGFLSLKDLRADRAEWWDPIHIDYRGVRIYSASPPANTFDALARLGVMERFDVRALGHNTAQYLHTFAEVTKQGFWLRLRFASDPEVSPVPVARLFSRSYLDSLAQQVDRVRARPFVPPGTSSDGSTHTTHFVVADRWGNVVSATQTIGNIFGSRIMPAGTGIWLNNSLAYSTFEPKGNPMDAFPGRHKLSGDVPVIAFKDGRPWIAIGTPGGHTIGQTVPQMLMNLIDFGMDLQSALDASRISFSEPDVLLVESEIPDSVLRALSAKGHKVRPSAGLGNAHALSIEYDRSGRPSRFGGASDSRGEGTARGAHGVR